jgi:hypothetical protein
MYGSFPDGKLANILPEILAIGLLDAQALQIRDCSYRILLFAIYS